MSTIIKAAAAGGASGHVIVDSGSITVANFPATQPVSSTDGALVTIGTTTDAAAAGNGSVIGLLKKIRDTLLGTLTISGAVTNANLDVALSTRTKPADQQHAIVDSSALPTGAATEATLDARTGSLVEAAPGTDTASSGLNGRLQRIAQRLTSLIALLPASLGQKTMAASLAVTIASDQASVPVAGGKTTNNAVPGATNVGALSAIATAANPALTEGNLVAESVDLAGRMRTREVEILIATSLSTANAGVTLTLAAAGAGLFHYITSIEIININPTAAAIVGSAVTLAYTSTNIPGAPAWTAGNALAAGAEKIVERMAYNSGIKTTTANTATTIVAPAIGAGGLCRIIVTYYIAA